MTEVHLYKRDTWEWVTLCTVDIWERIEPKVWHGEKDIRLILKVQTLWTSDTKSWVLYLEFVDKKH